jgi:hypothetical protein
MAIVGIEETGKDLEPLTAFVVREPEVVQPTPTPYLELEKEHQAAIYRQRLVDGFILAGLIYGLLRDAF